MDVLLTFTGFHDPYSPGLVGGQEQPGPVLSLVGARRFDRVVLFSTPTVARNTAETGDVLRARHPEITVDTVELDLPDPTEYLGILRALRKHTQMLLSQAPDAHYFVAVASGTPQMHACWVLLTCSGEIPARILHVRPPKYVTKDLPMVSEVNLTAPDFPEVRSMLLCEPELAYGDHVSLGRALEELGIVGEHPEMVAALKMAAVIAEHDAPILIQGETGTGKELVARLVHRLSPRSSGPFVPVNCAAMPEHLVESLLFGHAKGAFTGAVSDRAGKFQEADGGTLFFDELGELPLEVQPKLLRVLEDGLVEPLGAKKAKQVDVRIVAATNRELEGAIRGGAFREDLYYRLAYVIIRLPALRERRSDIPRLALQILDRLNKSLRRPKRLSPEALTRLQQHSWRGNVRDLENVLGRSLLLGQTDVLEPDDLLIDEPRKKRDPLASLPEPSAGFSLEGYLKSVRKQLILHALETSGGNQSAAARLLGISAQAVHKFLKKERT